MLVEPAVMTMYATCIVQDKVTGVTYMDTVTASVGRVALGNPCMAATLPGPTMAEEDLAEGHPKMFSSLLISLNEKGRWLPRNIL